MSESTVPESTVPESTVPESAVSELPAPAVAPLPADAGGGVSAIPGAAVVERIRGLVWFALVLSTGYGLLVRGVKQSCFPGGVEPSTCAEIQMGPSPLVWLAAAAIVLVALRRVTRVARSEVEAIRLLDRASHTITALIVVAFTWFAVVGVPDVTGPYSIVFPFPFATGDVHTLP